MSVSRSVGWLIGTSETVGDSIANNATDTGAEVDVLGADNVAGVANFFLYATSSVAAGTIDVYLDKQQEHLAADAKLNPDLQITPIVGTVKYPLGERSVSRYMLARVKNNAIGAGLTNVSVGYELFKLS